MLESFDNNLLHVNICVSGIEAIRKVADYNDDSSSLWDCIPVTYRSGNCDRDDVHASVFLVHGSIDCVVYELVNEPESTLSRILFLCWIYFYGPT